jgi:hypothetical protein
MNIVIERRNTHSRVVITYPNEYAPASLYCFDTYELAKAFMVGWQACQIAANYLIQTTLSKSHKVQDER